jgi:hypothetical protein
VFLERKLRSATHLNKRRTVIALADLSRIHDRTAAWDGTWFARRLAARRLQPVCQISYARTAREAMRDTGRVRLTLDESIHSVSRSMLAFSRDPGTPLVPDRVVLELKYYVAMPAVFKQLVEEFSLTAERVSKYRFAVRALGLAGTDPADADPAVGATYA